MKRKLKLAISMAGWTLAFPLVLASLAAMAAWTMVQGAWDGWREREVV